MTSSPLSDLAGVHHDHLFVPVERAAGAMAALRKLRALQARASAA
jgi:hypothetical protein